jgi:hypothetical protein
MVSPRDICLEILFWQGEHMDIKHIKYLLDIFEEAVEKRSQVYEIADDENDENQAAAECGAAKAELIRAIEQLIVAKENPSG